MYFLWSVQERGAKNERESLKTKAAANNNTNITTTHNRVTVTGTGRPIRELKLVAARKWRRMEKKDGTFGGWES